MLTTVGLLWQTADGLIVDDLLPLGGCSTREGFVKRVDVHSLLRFRCLKHGFGADDQFTDQKVHALSTKCTAQ